MKAAATAVTVPCAHKAILYVELFFFYIAGIYYTRLGVYVQFFFNKRKIHRKKNTWIYLLYYYSYYCVPRILLICIQYKYTDKTKYFCRHAFHDRIHFEKLYFNNIQRIKFIWGVEVSYMWKNSHLLFYQIHIYTYNYYYC